MRGVLRRGGAGGMQMPSEEAVLAMHSNVTDGKDVKISQCWLPVASTAEHTKHSFEFIIADEDTPEGTRSMLALFKELDQVDELIPPPVQPPGTHTPSAPPRIGETLAPRTNRIHSENTMTINALSDLVHNFYYILRYSLNSNERSDPLHRLELGFLSSGSLRIQRLRYFIRGSR